MGQKHQIFIVLPNPLKDSPNKEHIEKFGNLETTVLAYHHQWLYGATAVTVCHNILMFFENNNKIKGDNAILHNLDYHLSYRNLPETIQCVINNVRHPIVKGYGRAWGVEGAFYEPDYRHDYSCGDNNDGVMIIDARQKKYCFMNIFMEQDVSRNDVSALPVEIPSTAEQYFKCYYPDEKHNEAALKIRKSFRRFNLLTKEEVLSFFPEKIKRTLNNKH